MMPEVCASLPIEEDRYCHLCRKKSQVRQSHIIPSFAYKWLKESSATGFLRKIDQPNKRVQDGIKEHWLCGECEERFNRWETIFAHDIFHPINQDPSYKAIYGPWLLKFCTSVSWRALSFLVSKGEADDFSPELKADAVKTLQVWKDFLLDGRPHPGAHEQHFLPLDIVESYKISDAPTNLNRYFLRSIDIALPHTNNLAFVYCKICRFVVVGFIRIPQHRHWRGTMVHVSRGVIEPRDFALPDYFLDFLIERARQVQEAQQEITPSQQKNVADTCRRDMERVTSSETITALVGDVTLFGPMKT